jgi:Ca2+-binding RTX toxin-like protein
VVGSKFNDAIYGNNAANNLSGGDGDDVLSGQGGDDIISGGNGKDLIFDGSGADTLSGGQDADTFVFSSTQASVMLNGKPQDVITDFESGVDHIDLTAFGLQNGQFIELDNQNIAGTNYSVIGVDANGNHQLDEGEFAVAVKMAPAPRCISATFCSSSVILRSAPRLREVHVSKDGRAFRVCRHSSRRLPRNRSAGSSG